MNKILHILIIDDNPDDRSLIVRLLNHEFPGVRINEILEEEDYIRALNEGDFDLVITDYKLSWTNGLKVLYSVKEHSPDTPVIMFTGSGNEEIAVEAMKVGLDDYIIKSPDHFVRLSRAIKHVLKGVEHNKAFKEPELRYQKLFERVPIGLYRTSLDGRILDANLALLRMLGYDDRESLLSINAEELYVYPEDRESWIRMMERNGVIRGFEMQLRRLDDKIIWVRDIANAVRDIDGQLLYYEGSLEDITKRKQAEKALKDSEKTYRGIYDTTLALAEGTDLDVVIQVIVDQAAELLNGRDCIVYVLDRDRKVLLPLYSNAPKGKDEIMSYELPPGKGLSGRVSETGIGAYINFGDKDDYSICIPGTDKEEDALESVISVPMFDGEDVLGVITVGKLGSKFQDSDIEELTVFARQAEIAIKRARSIEELRESEEKYRILVEESHDAIYIYDGNSLIFVNDKMCDISGYTKEELYKMEIFEIIHPEDRDRLKEIAIKREEGQSVPKTFQARVLTKNGDVRICEFAAEKITFKGKYASLGVVRDITEYKEMEDEIQRAEKLKSIGILAGGIAHDFNNLLTGIMGNISLAKMYIDPENESFGILTVAEKTSRKAESLTQQLLTFSRGGAPIKETASITEIIKESTEFALRGSNVRCDFHFPEDLWMVEIDRGQMSQVINNIIINADQAMPDGGVIRVSASNKIISEDDILSINPGKYVEISIEDKGIGISEENLSNIFDPFFSTKERSSGLGLTTAYSIIRRHDGYITAESEVGVGSTFYIYLPVLLKEGQIEEREGREESFKGGGGTILLMDDEEVIRDVAGKMLERLGYEVEFASNGEEAVQLYREAFQSGESYNAVIMDLTIPGGMGGEETIGELLKIDSDVKAIVSSGYFNDPVMANFKDYGFSGVVPKPYDLGKLDKVLKGVLVGGNNQGNKV